MHMIHFYLFPLNVGNALHCFSFLPNGILSALIIKNLNTTNIQASTLVVVLIFEPLS